MPSSRDTQETEPHQVKQTNVAASSELLNARGIWFKVLGMLQQTWAVCEPTATGCRVRFFEDDSTVFDRLEFPDASSAGRALSYNGFTRLKDRPSFMAVAPVPRFPLIDPGANSMPVYSSGKHWQAPPEGFEHRSAKPFSSLRDTDPLDRFIDAQDPVWFNVLEELIAERKRTHWMWFVFPQHRLLGRSGNSKYFGLESLTQAEKYWEHHVLGPRLRLACTLMLAIEGKSAEDVLGLIDAMKLQSCATLFGLAAANEQVFAALITKYFKGKLCAGTVKALEQGP